MWSEFRVNRCIGNIFYKKSRHVEFSPHSSCWCCSVCESCPAALNRLLLLVVGSELPGGDVRAAWRSSVAPLESGAGRSHSGPAFPRPTHLGGPSLPNVSAQVQLLPQLRGEQHVRSSGALVVLTWDCSVPTPQVCSMFDPQLSVSVRWRCSNSSSLPTSSSVNYFEHIILLTHNLVVQLFNLHLHLATWGQQKQILNTLSPFKLIQDVMLANCCLFTQPLLKIIIHSECLYVHMVTDFL